MQQLSRRNSPVVKTLCVDIGPRGTTFHITRRARTCTHGRELWCSYRAKPSGTRKWVKVVPYDGYSSEYLEDFDCVKHCDSAHVHSIVTTGQNNCCASVVNGCNGSHRHV